MGIAVAGLMWLILLVFFLVIMRQTGFYLYVWIPLAVNLSVWTCLGGLLSFALFREWRREVGTGIGMGSVGMFAPLIWIAAACTLVLAIATIAMFPPRKAWSRQAVR